jgi:putative ABC transport system permease protein
VIAQLKRLRDRLRRGRLADELDRELRFHQSMLEREFRSRGLGPVDAASAARRELGNRTTIREESRDMWSFAWLEDPMLDLRYGIRALRRTPAFTIVAVLTLALGMGAITAMFAVVNGVLLKPLPYGNPGRLVGAWHDMAPLNLMHAQQTEGTYYTYQRLAHTIDGIAVYQGSAVNVAAPGGTSEPKRVTSAWVSRTLIPLLQIPPLRGRDFTEAEDLPNGPAAVIISEAMWRGQFGADPDILRRTLDVNGRTRQIVGVMPARFQFPTAATELWLPVALDPGSPNTGGFNYNAIARLKPGATVEDAKRDFATVLKRMPELFPNVVPGVTTQMLLDQAKIEPVLIPLKEDMTGGIARTLWVVAVASTLVLLVACANVTNLILVRVDGRQREIAVREALGAGRGRVMMHFLAESAVLAGVGAALGLAFAWAAVRALVSAGPADIPRLAELGIDAQSIAFAVLVAAVVALGCTAIPVMRIGRSNLSKSLREGGRGGTAGRVRHRVRGALVAAQMAMALVVLAGSALLVRTFQHLNSIKPGFDPAHVETFWVALPAARYRSDSSLVRFYSQLVDRVGKLAGVQAAGVTSRVPLEQHGVNWNPYYPENDASYANKLPPLAVLTTVDAGYFRVMRIPLITGRMFDRIDAQRDLEVLVSRRVAELFYHDSTGAAALGKRFRSLPSGPWSTIVGVVADARDSSLAAPPSPTVYYPEATTLDSVNGQTARTMALVVRTAGDPLGIVSAVQATVHDLDPTLPTFEIQSMTTVFSASMATLTFIILILGAAAAVTLILGAIGLYGVMAYVVTLRTRELGVRVALGAQPGTVAAMMTRQGLVLAGIGLVAGLAVFALLARFLRSFLFGVAPGDPVALGAASIILLAIAVLATWIPARRASRVDPAAALRAE